MKFLICIIIATLSAVAQCGIHRSSYFLDPEQNEIMTDETEEIHVPLRKDTRVVGAPRLINTDDSYVNRILNQHLGRLITGDSNKITIDGIDEITQQVVAGSLYRIKGHYIIEGQKKDCVVTVLVQPWITEESVIISGKCEDGSCYVTETYTCSPDSLYSTFMKREKRLMLFSQQ